MDDPPVTTAAAIWRRAPPLNQLDVRPFSNGVSGALTYLPDALELATSRIHEKHAPRVYQVTPFKRWVAPAAPDDAPSSKETSYIAKSQKAWLGKYYPEAILIDTTTEKLLPNEIEDSKKPEIHRPLTSTSDLVDTCEIPDLRDPQGVKLYPVVAFASGEPGNVLRLVGLYKEEWAWDGEHVKADLLKPEFGISGEWSQDSHPITFVKFVKGKTEHETIRWLLVQKPTTTVVFEPKMTRIPTRDTAFLEDTSSLFQLSANPLFAISSGQTGGARQTSVSFRFGSDHQYPQLAIIDVGGQWSIWDIHGRRTARPKHLRPTMTMCGNMTMGPTVGFPINRFLLQRSHSITWLSLDRENLRQEDEDGPTSPSEKSGGELPPTRRRLVLLCNITTIHLFDVESGEFSDASQKLLYFRVPVGARKLLNVKASPLDPSQAFILTDTTLFLVAAKYTNRGKLDLDILAACPHLKGRGDLELRFDVSPTTIIQNEKACVVSMHSPQNSQITVAWFISSEPPRPVRYHFDMVDLGAPPIFSSVVLPRVSQQQEWETQEKPNVKFMQLLALGRGLSLKSTLCAWSEGVGPKLTAPDHKRRKGAKRSFQKKERRKFLEAMDSAFVVPDGYDERPRFGKPKPKLVDMKFESEDDTEPPPPLVERIWRVMSKNPSGRKRRSFKGEEAKYKTIADAIEGKRHYGVMPRHSLLALAGGKKMAADDLFEVASGWENEEDDLPVDAIRITPQGRRYVRSGLHELAAKYEDLYSYHSTEMTNSNDDDNNDDDTRMGRDEDTAEIMKDDRFAEMARRFAAELHLSQIEIATELPTAPTKERWGGASQSSVRLQSSQSSVRYDSSPPLLPTQEVSDISTSQMGDSNGKEISSSRGLRKYMYLMPVKDDRDKVLAIRAHFDRGCETHAFDWKPWGLEEWMDDAYLKMKARTAKRQAREARQASLRPSATSQAASEAPSSSSRKIHSSTPRTSVSRRTSVSSSSLPVGEWRSVPPMLGASQPRIAVSQPKEAVSQPQEAVSQPRETVSQPRETVSQPRETIRFPQSSQAPIMSQMPMSSQPVMSQVMPGMFGGRTQKKAKKKTSGFR